LKENYQLQGNMWLIVGTELFQIGTCTREKDFKNHTIRQVGAQAKFGKVKKQI
jgi:hypothetical protein